MLSSEAQTLPVSPLHQTDIWVERRWQRFFFQLSSEQSALATKKLFFHLKTGFTVNMFSCLLYGSCHCIHYADQGLLLKHFHYDWWQNTEYVENKNSFVAIGFIEAHFQTVDRAELQRCSHPWWEEYKQSTRCWSPQGVHSNIYTFCPQTFNCYCPLSLSRM